MAALAQGFVRQPQFLRMGLVTGDALDAFAGVLRVYPLVIGVGMAVLA